MTLGVGRTVGLVEGDAEEIKDEDEELGVTEPELFTLVAAEPELRAADQLAPTTTGFFAVAIVAAVRKLLGPEGRGR